MTGKDGVWSFLEWVKSLPPSLLVVTIPVLLFIWKFAEIILNVSQIDSPYTPFFLCTCILCIVFVFAGWLYVVYSYNKREEHDKNVEHFIGLMKTEQELKRLEMEQMQLEIEKSSKL